MSYYTINYYARLLMILLVSSKLHAHDWTSLLERYKTIIEGETHSETYSRAYAIINNQHQKFLAGSAPKIADPRVKNIPINECENPIVNLYDMKHSRVKVMPENMLLKAHAHPDHIDPRSDSHPCMRQKVFETTCQVVVELDALTLSMPELGYKPGDLDIYLFEGWRDIATQKLLFDTKMAQVHAENPDLTEEQAYAETSTWVSPYIDNVPAHSTGAAIDIAIWSNEGQCFLDMGPFNKGGATAPIFSQDPSLQDHQKNNRLLLLAAATRAGLTNYVYEFWHYSYGDKYACFWRNNEQHIEQYHAIYGSK